MNLQGPNTLRWFRQINYPSDVSEAARAAVHKRWWTLTKIQKRREALEHVDLGGESGW